MRKNDENRVGEQFDHRAAHYDNPITAHIGELELRQIRIYIPAHSVVLDYGCGTGRTTLDLLQRGCRVTAFDISQEMMRIAEYKARKAGFTTEQAEFQTDVHQLLGRHWPVITCIGVLDYYPDPRPLFLQLRNLISPGGRLVVTFPNASSPLGWLYGVFSKFTVPSTPQKPEFIQRVVTEIGWKVVGMRFAFPAVRNLGHTIVVALE